MIRKLLKDAREFRVLTNSFGLKEGSAAYVDNFVHGPRLSSNKMIKQLQIKGISHPLFYRPGTSDFDVLKYTFIHGAYDIQSRSHMTSVERFCAGLLHASKCPIIIDCGANIGFSSIWYATRFPQAKIYAVEPEPENFAVLVKNCTPFGSITPIQAAISDRETKVSLTRPVSGEPWAWRTKESESGTIPTVTVPSLVSQDENGALLIVKINIEGFEVEMFRSNVEWVRETPLIVYEAHDWLFPWHGTAHAVLSVLCKQPRDYIQRDWNTFAFAHFLKASNLGRDDPT